jgi:hypothetical protein
MTVRYRLLKSRRGWQGCRSTDSWKRSIDVKESKAGRETEALAAGREA